MLKILKIISVLFTVLMSVNLNAQQEHSTGMAPFIPFNNTNTDPIVFLPPDNFSTQISYAAYLDVVTQENKFASIPLPSGQPITDIGPGFVSASTPCADFGPGGVLYAVSQIPPYLLVSINPATGIRSTIANVTGSSLGTITSMAYNELTNTMYLGTSNGEVSRLYTLNLTTGSASLIGEISNCPVLITLAINCEGKAYGLDIAGDKLLAINLNTAAGTVIGSIGFNANFLQDSDFDPDNGNLYLAAYNASASPGIGQLRIANLNTGATTLITNWGQGVEVTGYAIPGVCFLENDVSAGPFKPFPVEFVANTAYNIKAVIENPGLVNQPNFPVKFFVNGIESGILIASLNSGAEDSVSYSWTPGATGSYQLKIITALANDERRENDTVTANVQVFGSETLSIFCDDFSNGTGNWTITNNGGNCIWQVFTPPYPNLYTLPETSSGGVLSADSDECGQGSTMNTTVTITDNLDCSGKENILFSWDNDWRYLPSCIARVEVSYNGGTSWQTVVEWNGVPRRNSKEFHPLPGASNNANVKIRFVSSQPEWAWWWAIDNVCLTGNIILDINQTGSGVPNTFELHQNYPNPFNPVTKINYGLPVNSHVSLKVYDVMGREAATLVNEIMTPGYYTAEFNGANLPSGVYFYRLTANNSVITKKMLMIK